MVVKIPVIKIGNSQGVRIPKIAWEQLGTPQELEMVIEDTQIILRLASDPRAGWEDQFRAMAANGDDRLLDEEVNTSSWDDTEWEWE